jgi:hypothetical protein
MADTTPGQAPGRVPHLSVRRDLEANRFNWKAERVLLFFWMLGLTQGWVGALILEWLL